MFKFCGLFHIIILFLNKQDKPVTEVQTSFNCKLGEVIRKLKGQTADRFLTKKHKTPFLRQVKTLFFERSDIGIGLINYIFGLE